MELTQKTKEILRDEATMMRIALDCEVTLNTVRRWIRKDNERMATLKCVNSISKHTGLPKSEIFK